MFILSVQLSSTFEQRKDSDNEYQNASDETQISADAVFYGALSKSEKVSGACFKPGHKEYCYYNQYN